MWIIQTLLCYIPLCSKGRIIAAQANAIQINFVVMTRTLSPLVASMISATSTSTRTRTDTFGGAPHHCWKPPTCCVELDSYVASKIRHIVEGADTPIYALAQCQPTMAVEDWRSCLIYLAQGKVRRENANNNILYLAKTSLFINNSLVSCMAGSTVGLGGLKPPYLPEDQWIHPKGAQAPYLNWPLSPPPFLRKKNQEENGRRKKRGKMSTLFICCWILHRWLDLKN